jgi:replicative superfamily II helicase
MCLPFVAGLYFFLFQYDYLCRQGTGNGVDYQQDDIGLIQKRTDVVHSAAVLLEKCQLIKSEWSTGRFQSLELGRIASHYYVTYNLIMVYNQHLRPTMSMLELFRVFALSNEFKLLHVSFLFLLWSSFLTHCRSVGPSRSLSFSFL